MKNVLLVDDDPVWNVINKKNFEFTGLVESIDIAVNGRDAIDLLEQYNQTDKRFPDVILLDINMPILNGFGFLEAFRNLPPTKKSNTRISILSSSQNESDFAKAKDFGVSQYFVKPLKQSDFMKLLEPL